MQIDGKPLKQALTDLDAAIARFRESYNDPNQRHNQSLIKTDLNTALEKKKNLELLQLTKEKLRLMTEVVSLIGKAYFKIDSVEFRVFKKINDIICMLIERRELVNSCATMAELAQIDEELSEFKKTIS